MLSSVFYSPLCSYFRKLHPKIQIYSLYVALLSSPSISHQSVDTPLQRQINAQSMLLFFCLLSSYYLLGVDNMESLLSQPGTCKSCPDTRQKDAEWKWAKRRGCKEEFVGSVVIVSFAAKPVSAIVPALQGCRVSHAERACFRLIIYSWFSFHVAAAEISTEENSLVRFVIKSASVMREV